LTSPNLDLSPRRTETPKPELRYVKPPIQAPIQAPEQKKELPRPEVKQEPLLKLPERITLEKKLPEQIGQKMPLARPEFSFPKPALMKTDVIPVKKKITLPPLELDKINNPTYLSYYQIVREKIKRAAYQNYTGQEVGEVTVSFIILKDGALENLMLVEEKSSGSAYLRDIALRSIRNASAFPPFPAELDYPRLSFNISITFEVE